MRRAAIALVLILSLTAGWSPSKLATGTVKSALIDAGLSEANAKCMAGRMTDKLSLGQLLRLRKLKRESRSLTQFVEAVRKHGDREMFTVTASAAFMCTTGLAG